MNIKKPLPFILIAGLLTGCNNDTATTGEGITVTANGTPTINYAVTAYYPHDTTSFTEGFLSCNGQLYESTGSPGNLAQTKSLFGIVDLKTGKIDKKAEIDREKYFGEGITILNNKIYQLTYTSNTGFIYDAKTFRKTGEFNFKNKEGWGLTTDGKNLVMSDGTDKITYLNPADLKPVKTLSVKSNNSPLDSLNELEYIDGFIYANRYTTNYIFKIDTQTGNVVSMLNLDALDYEAKNRYPHALEMNGIAFDSAKNKIYITGKLWPNIYEISFAH